MRVKAGTKMPVQFKMRTEESLVKALERAAENYGRRSAQQVAEEILKAYLPFWEQMEQTRLNKYEEQRQQVERQMEAIWVEKASPLQKKRAPKKSNTKK